MFSIRLYIHIMLRVLLILGIWCAALSGIVTQKAIILGCFGLVGGFLLVIELVGYLNRTNRKMHLFLDTIENRESMLAFPEKVSGREEQLLYQAFNRVNQLLKELKMESRKQEQFFITLLQHIPGGVISWNEEGKIRIVNEVALALLDLSSLHYITQIEQVWPRFRETVDEAIRDGGHSTLLIEQHQMVRQLSFSLKELTLPEEKVYILIVQDIGKELSKKEFESWDRLTHVMTHEIMNSIAPIVSLSGTLLSYFRTKENLKTKDEITDALIHKSVRGLEAIRSQGEGLMRFTNSYRRLSYVQPPTMQLFSLRQFMEAMALLFQPDMDQAGIHFSYSLPRTDLFIKADQEQISQVVVNLLKNAMESVEVSDHKEIHLKTRQEEEVLFIEISDNGPGIPEDIKEDIFIPFFTTKVKGSGIGLSLSRQIIRMHGGDLTVVSKPYEKTCFTLILPYISYSN